MKRRAILRLTSYVLSAACSACITINLYFPVAELREAAAEIVNEARPDVVSAPPDAHERRSNAPEGGAQGGSPPGEKKTSGAILSIFRLSTAHAEERKEEKKDAKKIQLNITTPVIKKIRETLKARYPKLLPFYEKGAVGEGADGHLALRDTDGLGLKEKRDVQALLKEENEDRKNLYTQIARGNAIEDSRVPDIGKLFSEEWQRKSKAGWWIEKEKGKWEKKGKEKK